MDNGIGKKAYWRKFYCKIEADMYTDKKELRKLKIKNNRTVNLKQSS